MSATLSRRLRRIGLLPTTYKESTEQRLVKENGKAVERTFKKSTPVRHKANLTAEERALAEDSIRGLHRNRSAAFRQKRKG